MSKSLFRLIHSHDKKKKKNTTAIKSDIHPDWTDINNGEPQYTYISNSAAKSTSHQVVKEMGWGGSDSNVIAAEGSNH